MQLREQSFSDLSFLRLSQASTPPFGDYLASTRDMVTRLHRTSGTTGQAMNLALSARDCEITEAIGGRSQRSAGLRARLFSGSLAEPVCNRWRYVTFTDATVAAFMDPLTTKLLKDF
jgi:phenylacetate-coenzyme A ligase PaaK-like adenylate-forming protein